MNLINCRLEFGEGVVCGFLREGGSNDKDIRFESDKTQAWLLGAEAWVQPCGDNVF